MQSVKRMLLLSMSVRLVLDISMGVFSPYLPVIARGLGVSVAVMGILLSVRGAFGLTNPIFGVLIDRLGARRILMAALALLAVGTGMLATSPAFAPDGTIAGVTSSNLWLWRGMPANATLAAGVALIGVYIGLRYVIDGELQPAGAGLS